jgi:hypothetical protein
MRCGRPLPAGRVCTIALSASPMNLHAALRLPRQRHPHRVRRPIPSSAPARSLSRIRFNAPAAGPTFRALPTNAATAGVPDPERGPRIVSPCASFHRMLTRRQPHAWAASTLLVPTLRDGTEPAPSAVGGSPRGRAIAYGPFSVVPSEGRRSRGTLSRRYAAYCGEKVSPRGPSGLGRDDEKLPYAIALLLGGRLGPKVSLAAMGSDRRGPRALTASAPMIDA